MSENELTSLSAKWQKTLETLGDPLKYESLILTLTDSQSLFAASNFQYFKAQEVLPAESSRFFNALAITNSSLIVNQLAKDVDYQDTFPSAKAIAAVAGVSLSWPDGSPFGALCAIDSHTDRFDESDIEILHQIADFFEASLLILDNFAQIQKLSDSDPLTAILTRAAFFVKAEEEIKRARRYSRSLSVMFMDLDSFKEINEDKGHEAGDMILIELTRIVNSIIRSHDVFARYDGDQFVLLLPETGDNEAELLAERIVHQLREVRLQSIDTPNGISISTATATLESEMDLAGLLEEADKSLQIAMAKRDIENIFD
jgi:diguanylate cyclase (GGDEF)-like protein